MQFKVKVPDGTYSSNFPNHEDWNSEMTTGYVTFELDIELRDYGIKSMSIYVVGLDIEINRFDNYDGKPDDVLYIKNNPDPTKYNYVLVDSRNRFIKEVDVDTEFPYEYKFGDTLMIGSVDIDLQDEKGLVTVNFE